MNANVDQEASVTAMPIAEDAGFDCAFCAPQLLFGVYVEHTVNDLGIIVQLLCSEGVRCALS